MDTLVILSIYTFLLLIVIIPYEFLEKVKNKKATFFESVIVKLLGLSLMYIIFYAVVKSLKYVKPFIKYIKTMVENS